MMPLSVRNNNPGNLRPVGSTGGFQSFASPEEGIEAMKRDLMLKISGQSKAMQGNFGEGYQPTLANLISTWAPPSENDTQNYINFVSQKTGLTPDSLVTEEHLDPLVMAMIEQEGGQKATDYFGGETPLTPEEEAELAALEAQTEEAPLTPEEEAELAMLEAGPQPEQPQLTPAQEFSNEHPILRTAGRAVRTGLGGLSSLVDLGLLVPKTAALATGLGAEAMGAEGLGRALQDLGKTPTVRDMTVGAIDNATGGKLQPIGAIDKTGDFLGELISSAVPFTKGPQALNSIAPKPPTAGTALQSVLDPETALNQLPSVQAAKTAMLPLPKVTDEGKKVVELAKKYDIPVGLDDVTDSKFYKTMISEGQNIPFSGSEKRVQNQLSKFNQAVSKSIGANTEKITPDIIDSRFRALGKEFDNFFKGKTINLGEDFGLGLRQDDFIKEVSDNYAVEGKSILDKYMGQINSTIKPDGSVDGEALGMIRNRVSKIARQSKNPEISSAARDLENFIIDSVSDVSEEGAKQAFKKTKYQYKNLIAIEPLAAKDQIGGQISPAQLLGRVRQVYGRAFSKGDAGELGDLANIGQYIKETIPNSGTAQRTGARNILTGNLMGMVPTAAFGGPLAALAQGGLSAGAMVGNRALQNRNFDQELLELAMKNLPKSTPLLTQKGALAALAGANTAGQRLLEKPPLRITVRPSDAGVRP